MRPLPLLVSSLVLSASAVPALAQDAPSPAATPAPAADNDFTWSGPYFGANGGWSWDDRTRFYNTFGDSPNNSAALTNGLRPEHHSIDDRGFVVGGQIGYNYQVGGFNDQGLALVTGIEADADYTDIRRTDTLSNTTFLGPLSTPSATPYTRVNQYSSKLDFLGTVRGRVGIATHRAMLYGTAGFAYGHVDRSSVYYGPNAPTTPYFAGNSNGMKGGYVYGGGVEFALPTHSFFNFLHSSAVTVKAEFLRYHLANDPFTYDGVNGGAGLGGYTARVRDTGNIARAGINYKF